MKNQPEKDHSKQELTPEKIQNPGIKLLRSLLFPIFGLVALLWFLIRVIPRPSRVGYPCQRVAAPVAMSFLWWLGSLGASIFLFQKVRRWNRNILTLVASGALLIIIIALIIISSPSLALWAEDPPFVPSDPPNSPMGVARGIHPGRVVWNYNPKATGWQGSGYWWDDRYTDAAAVSQMLSQSLQALTGTTSDAQAWEAIFKYFNKNHQKGNVGYQAGEKIAIKLNMNQINDHNKNRNQHFPLPQLVHALVSQLVHQAGVPEANITLYDATRYIAEAVYTKCHRDFPNLKFVDWGGGDGCQKQARDLNCRVHWSEKLTLEPGGGNPTYLPKCVTEAAYLINLPVLRGHNLAGITLCAKNHFGSIIADDVNHQPNSSAPKNAGVHPYVCVHDEFHFGGHWDFDKRAMGTYNALVDLMGHAQLGQKTLLYMIDGFYAVPDQSRKLEMGHRWKSAPFNNDWPSSLFISQDGVALESVGLDFLRAEPTMIWVKGNVDNYLHEAALANAPPSKTKYDPEGDGTYLPSLGVHEHWNNANEKLYSRNLGIGNGIELISLNPATAVKGRAKAEGSDQWHLSGNYPNPFNSATTIQFRLPKTTKVTLTVYNGQGQVVRTLLDQVVPAGEQQIRWDGKDQAGQQVVSGIYLYQFRAAEFVAGKKCILIQ